MIVGSSYSTAALISYGLHNWNLLVLMLLIELSSPRIKELDTSPKKAWKALIKAVWTAALEITPRMNQLHVDHVTFLDQCAEPSIPLLGG